MVLIHGNGTTFTLNGDLPLQQQEEWWELPAGTGSLPTPHVERGDRIWLPVDEGIALEADGVYEKGDLDFEEIAHPFCSREATMSLILIERGDAVLMIALEDGRYASYALKREAGIYQLSLHATAPTRVWYAVTQTAVQACKLYRRLKGRCPLTLKQKADRNPALKQLFGGAVFWIWNETYDEVMYADHNTTVEPATGDALLTVAAALKADGVDKALMGIFFHKDSPYAEPLYRDYGYLSTQYDNYNDVLNPALLDVIPCNRVAHCDYTARRLKDFPAGLARDAAGNPLSAWALRGFDGKMHDQNCLCPAIARDRMIEEVAQVLRDYPAYKGRFVDVYGTGLTLCHDPSHPVTAETCVEVKRQAFEGLNGLGLLVGTEDGMEDLIDTLAYSEGIHSPSYFRIANAGRRHANSYNSEEERHISRHMLNPACRVPMWHLVYHDCLLTFPYWGDSTDDSLAQVADKVLFACLFGCPPLYSFAAKEFPRLKEAIVSSYRRITEVHEKVATLPMTDYRVLTEDYSLQTTVFGDRYRVVANFSEEAQTFAGKTVPAKDFLFMEI